MRIRTKKDSFLESSISILRSQYLEMRVMNQNRFIIFIILIVSLLHINLGYRRLFSYCFRKETNYRVSRYDYDIIETRPNVNAVPSLKGVKTKIIQLISPSSIEAVQLRHIEVETKEMATFCKSLLTNNSSAFINVTDEKFTGQSILWDFASLAANISRCERSKVVGGDLGWVFLDQVEDRHSDDLLGSLAREATVLQKGV